MKTQTVKCKLNVQGFERFKEVLDDLSKIDDTIKLKIDEKNTFIYSMVGKDNVILAFKNFLLNTEDIFDSFKIEDKIDLIIPNAKKFVKNLGFIDLKSDVNLTFKLRELSEGGLEIKSTQVSNKKLKINWMSAEQYEVRDIAYESLCKLLDVNNQKLSFSVQRNDFEDVKKLANINGSALISLSSTNDNKITMSEPSAWELEVDEIDEQVNINYNVNKKFLGSVNDGSEPVSFHVFPNFLLVKEDTCNLMVSFEQTF